MKLQMMAIKDRALDAFMRPFHAQTIAQGERMFTDIVNEPNQEMNRHPEDYELYHLGEFDDHNGLTTNAAATEYDDRGNKRRGEEGPQLIARAQDVIRKTT